MIVVGLCGGSGSGKGLACTYFSELGIETLDTDVIYHSLISSSTPCLEEIVRVFGNTVLKDGAIDRRALAEIVFDSEEKRLTLNKIAHKHILEAVRLRISECEALGNIGVVIDAPLLFESGFDKECDTTICVLADDEIRINRIVARDSISRENAIKRINSQISNDSLKKLCDYVIYNDSSHEELRRRVIEAAKKIFGI